MNQNNHKIHISQHAKSGILNNTYAPLQNLVKNGEITKFTSENLKYDISNYLNIDTQLSYDDSINLILNDDKSSPKIINTQFKVGEKNTYEYLVRNQGAATNLYNEESLNITTDLFLRSNIWPIIDLLHVKNDGILMGGNYTFYIKYCDEDYNETEIVSESGIISIFKGTTPSTIVGTLSDERTSKSIELQITNFDFNFNKFFIYFSRETSDLNGVLVTKYYKITTPFSISDSPIFYINGYENIEEISRESLLIKYNYFTAAKTQAIVQNMLFLGNLSTSIKDYPLLQQLSYRIHTTLKQKNKSIGYVNYDYSINLLDNNQEYYDPKNIYYNLGYWPEEYYQLGICYILNDGSVTEAFSLYGGKLQLDIPHYLSLTDNEKIDINKLLDSTTLANSGGVFKLPNVEIINHDIKTINPLYFEFSFDEYTLQELNKLGVQGYFFVRSKRTPVSLFQGLSVGIDEKSGLPMPYVETGIKTDYVVESFINDIDLTENYDKDQRDNITSRILSNDVNKHLRSIDAEGSTYSALLSLDPIINTQLQNILSWTNYTLDAKYSCKLESSEGSRLYNINRYKPIEHTISSPLVYINENIPSFYLEGKYFSTRAGNAENVQDFSQFEFEEKNKSDITNIARGIYSPIIGSNVKLLDSTIYSVKIDIENEIGWITKLINNNPQYFSITNRYKLADTTSETIINAFRGDCYTNTVTIRLNRNFIDPTFPANDKIVDVHTWRDNFGGINKTSLMSSTEKGKNDDFSWNNINLGDLNAVQLGQWITFKCLSNYNLGLRSIDTRDIVTMGKLGSQGSSFYPISGFNTTSNGKMPESKILNDGYGVSLSRKSYNKWIPTPFENWNFENRIAFSNVASTKMFTNGFRVFQGLSYQDVDKSFGSIVKLFPYAQNLLCVFEHGLAIVPINEKALLSTQEGLSIHLYGAGVLQEQVSVISPDYGSTWIESLIKTPDAYYGVDTNAKKIWKFNNTEGFQCISDFKIQSFLNDNLNLDLEDSFYLGATNVRTHYNNFKGDVIFTFYNKSDAYSLCYNERLKVWTSRYSWLPLLSANIDNYFYSFDREVVNKYTNIWKQTKKVTGIVCENPVITNNCVKIKYNGLLAKDISIKVKSLQINGVTYKSIDDFLPILTNGTICGSYFLNGIEGFINEGGSINENKQNYSLQGSPIKYNNKLFITMYLNSSDIVTSDMIPSKVYVYNNNNQLYITHDSRLDWQTYTPNIYEPNWWYIYTEVSLDYILDSDNKIWTTTIITNGWSIPQKYNIDVQNVASNSWYQIINHDIDGDVYRDIDYKNNLLLNSCYVGYSKTVGDLTLDSCIPIIIDDNDEDELDFIYNKLYSSYLYHDSNNSYYLYVPQSIFITNEIDVLLGAYYNNEEVEEYNLTISNQSLESISLYKHDINSSVTNWYDKQHPFEYEFVVNQPAGFHKIFNNLMIISNNVEPDSLEVEIVGDSYDFKEELISQNENIKYKFPIITLPGNKIYQTKLTLDKITNEHRLLMHQDCLNIKDFGRRLGNISYIEGKWYVVLQPIYYEDKTLKTTRLRDKWAKIRIKYSGEKLAIITAIQTLMNISYV